MHSTEAEADIRGLADLSTEIFVFRGHGVQSTEAESEFVGLAVLSAGNMNFVAIECSLRR